MGLGAVDGQVHGVARLGARSAMHHQDELLGIGAIAELQQQLGFGAGGLDHHHLGGYAGIGQGEGVAYSTLDLGVNYAATKHLWLTTNAAGGFGRLRNVYTGVQLTVGAAVQF